MNGFTNAILSLLLSWIRLLVAQLWKLISSDNGRSFFTFLADRWIALLLIICIGGYVVDRIVYILRWRPYYLWRNRRRAKARSVDEEPAEPVPVYPEEPVEPYPVYSEEPAGPYLPQVQAFGSPAFLGERPTALYRRPPIASVPASPATEVTNRYAPAYQNRTAAYAPPTAPYVPPNDIAPIFDDDPKDWASDGAPEPPESMAEVMANVKADFGAARPEPAAYLRDMQAGFARPLPPEQIYAPAGPAPIEARSAPPVHPGLDGDRIRENVGLSPAGALPEAEAAAAPSTYHAFAPFIPSDGKPQAQSRARNPFATLAKKARDFVGVADEDDPRTIHDLQPAVDMRSAFHEPVYPKPKPAKEGDDLSTY